MRKGCAFTCFAVAGIMLASGALIRAIEGDFARAGLDAIAALLMFAVSASLIGSGGRRSR